MTTPATAKTGREVDNLRQLALRMGGLAENILDKSLRAVWSRNIEVADQVATDDIEIDRIDVEIDTVVLSVLALHAPVAADLRQTLAIKTMATDLERVGDLARNIASCAHRLAEREPTPASTTLRQLADDSRRALSRSLQAFADLDVDLARAVLAGDDEIDEAEARAIRESIARIHDDPRICHQEIDMILIAKSLERVADHATNIAEEVVLAAESINLKHAGKLAT